MAIVRWNPWGYSNLSQVLDDNFMDMRWDDTTAVDVYETNDNVVVKAQLPGFSDDNIKVTIEGSTLTIRGEMREEIEDQKKKYYRKEIRTQSIARSITLPTPVASDKAEAKFDNGVLTLTLPKAEESKPKEITISRNK